MTVLLLGATGRTGKHVLNQLIERGHAVHILVRDKQKIKVSSELLTVKQGSPADPKALAQAMEGCDAIISVLNISRTSDFPWAKLRTPETFLSDTMHQILQLASAKSISRLIVCSAWGVHNTRKDIPGWFRWIIEHSNVGIAYADHERQENLVTGSELDYTIVRPVGLINTKKVKPFRVSQDNDPRPSLTIGRVTVAYFLADQLNSNQYSRQAITLSHA